MKPDAAATAKRVADALKRWAGAALVVVIALAVGALLDFNQDLLSKQLGLAMLVALEFLAFLFFAVALMFALAPRPTVSATELGMRRKIFTLNALLLIVLFAIALLRYRFPFDDSTPWLKTALHGIWFAMLGSVAISFKGVYDHTQPTEWNEGWWLWYLGRPLTGAIVGAVTYLLLQIADPNHPPSIPSLAVAAFVLGTQESRFFGFLYEVGKLVLTTPDSADVGLKVTSITPDHGTGGDVLLVTGTGFQAGATATLGGQALKSVQVAPGGTALTGLAPAQPAGTGQVDLVVANPSGGAFQMPKAFTYP